MRKILRILDGGMCYREKSSRRGDVVCMSMTECVCLCVCVSVGRGGAVLNRAVWEDITEKVISEQRAEGSEEMYHVRIWGRTVQAENSISKGPEEGLVEGWQGVWLEPGEGGRRAWVLRSESSRQVS